MKEVFADLTTDLVFKKAFASEQDKELLINLLNAFLERKLKHPIADVTIKNPYIQGETLENRDSIVDIRCKDAEGCVSLQDKLLYSLCHAHECEEQPDGLKGSMFDRLFTLIRISNFTPMEQDDYIRRAMFRADQREQLRYAKDIGKNEGIGIVLEYLKQGHTVAEAEALLKR